MLISLKKNITFHKNRLRTRLKNIGFFKSGPSDFAAPSAQNDDLGS
jgi:hypothetical protein